MLLAKKEISASSDAKLRVVDYSTTMTIMRVSHLHIYAVDQILAWTFEGKCGICCTAGRYGTWIPHEEQEQSHIQKMRERFWFSSSRIRAALLLSERTTPV